MDEYLNDSVQECLVRVGFISLPSFSTAFPSWQLDVEPASVFSFTTQVRIFLVISDTTNFVLKCKRIMRFVTDWPKDAVYEYAEQHSSDTIFLSTLESFRWFVGLVYYSLWENINTVYHLFYINNFELPSYTWEYRECQYQIHMTTIL